MCHGKASAFFPVPTSEERFRAEVDGYAFGNEGDGMAIAIIPDIYGCNPFYSGMATYLAQKGNRVFLIDPFAQIGGLAEVTREAALERRGKLRDREFLDKVEEFASDKKLDAIIGFCLGGLYVFDLARRGVNAKLIGLYGFPQGMPNQDPLPVPFDYLETLEKRHWMLMGAQDEPVGPENVRKLQDVASKNPAIQLTVFEKSGHGFLSDLDSDDDERRAVAIKALGIVEEALFANPDRQT